MSKHKVRITQTYTAARAIEIEVEAEDAEGAIELVKSGAVDIPAFDDPGWKTGWQLVDETYWVPA